MKNLLKIVIPSFVICNLSFVITPVMAFDHVLPAPAVSGPTGVVRIPSADVLP